MTVFTRWDPFREFSTLQDRMNRLFRESYSDAGRDESLTTIELRPAVDVYEDEHNVTLKIEVPGIDEKDIDVRVENNTLTVHGERKFEKEEKEENYRRVERQYGSFTRTFTLPTTVDTENVSGELRQGRAEDHSAQEGRSQAQADQGQRRQREDHRRQDRRRQEPQQSRVSCAVWTQAHVGTAASPVQRGEACGSCNWSVESRAQSGVIKGRGKRRFSAASGVQMTGL